MIGCEFPYLIDAFNINWKLIRQLWQSSSINIWPLTIYSLWSNTPIAKALPITRDLYYSNSDKMLAVYYWYTYILILQLLVKSPTFRFAVDALTKTPLPDYS